MRKLLIATPMLALLLMAAPSRAARAPIPAQQSALGLCFVYHDQQVWHDLAREAGASLNRWQLSWYEVEATKGDLDWSAFDPRVDADLASGMAVSAILMGTPYWAATKGTTLGPPVKAEVKEEPWTIKAFGEASTSASPPANLALPWDHPDNYWGRFVYQTVSHFKTRIKIWEMWNEEDWSFFWSGTHEDYYQLLKVGYQAAKAADPEATVLFGGLHLFADPDFFQDVLDLARKDPTAAAHGYYFDVLPLHLYSRSSQAYDNVNWVRWRMTLRGIDKPIWINETGAPVWNDGVGPGQQYEWSVTREEQADYLVQAYANALAAGVEKMLVFRLHDGNMWEAYGLVKNDGSRRPAFDAFRTIQTYLREPTFISRRRSQGTVVVTLYGAAQGKVTVLWNELPVASTVRLPAVMDAALRVDRSGHAQTITPQDGHYSLLLPGATASRPTDPGDYFVGGEPVIVVEQDTSPPTAAVHPLADVTQDPQFAVTWSGSDDASGVWSYDVQVRDGPVGAWAGWLTQTAQTSAVYSGQDRHTYFFRVRARDRAGNVGSYSDQAQAWTTVLLPPPTPTEPTLTPTPAPPTATVEPSCVEVLRNGGFEQGGDWTIVNTAYPARWVDRPVHSGSHALQTGIAQPPPNVYSYSSAEQTVALPAADRIALTYRYRAQVDPGDYAYVYLRPAGGNWQLLQISKQDQPAWVTVERNLDAYAGQTVTLRFGTLNDGRDGTSVMYVDDASIQACTGPSAPPSATPTATPTPSATPTATYTATPVPTATPTPTSVPSATPTATPTPTSVPSATPTVTQTPTVSQPTVTATAAPTLEPTPPPPCPELAVNGDFEASEGWVIANTPYRARYTGATARTGVRSLQLGIDNPAENRFAYSSAEQTFAIPADRAATLTLWYHVASGGGSGDYGYFLIRPDGGAWRTLRFLRESTAGWTPLAVDVSHYAGSAFTLRLGVRNDGPGDGLAAVMYVDAVSVRSCTQPEK